jgi:methylthioribose-1-phosphate isomerase
MEKSTRSNAKRKANTQDAAAASASALTTAAAPAGAASPSNKSACKTSVTPPQSKRRMVAHGGSGNVSVVDDSESVASVGSVDSQFVTPAPPGALNNMTFSTTSLFAGHGPLSSPSPPLSSSMLITPPVERLSSNRSVLSAGPRRNSDSKLPSVRQRAKNERSVYWSNGQLRMIDQRALPTELTYTECKAVADVETCIRDMVVRGAPAIGAAGAYGMVIAAIESDAKDNKQFMQHLKTAKNQLDRARPTAVNLSWATNRMIVLAKALCNHDFTIEQMREIMETEAENLADDDVRINMTLGSYGASVVPRGANVLHHCNTGSLATVDYGTAIGIIYACHDQGKNIHVWVDETRPRLQGARLTAWELMRAGVNMHLIADSASGHLMRAGKVNVVVFGADRVAANGDVANKIGTYNLAVVARENGVPVYCAVPTPTIDLFMESGDDIVIEERKSTEVTHVKGVQIAPTGCKVFNPAFDVTPHRYITGIVTEEGICYPPFSESLRAAKLQAEERMEQTWQKRLQEYLQKKSSSHSATSSNS